MPSRKSQAAMEFLLTYGWAMLVVLVVIAALAYFGVLSPAKLLPERCYFGTFGKCSDFGIIADIDGSGDGSDNLIWIFLTNNMGKPIETLTTNYRGDAGDCEIGLIIVLEPGKTPKDIFDAVLGGTCSGDTQQILKCLINEGYLKVVPFDQNFKTSICDPNLGYCTKWNAAESASIILINCPGIKKGQRVSEKVDLVYSYVGGSDLTHIAQGEIAGVAVKSAFTAP